MTTTLPTLYKTTSTGATQMWTIAVDGPTIITTYGQVGGKLQTTQDTLAEGKNLGRKNETTPAQQAFTEAQSQWEKKLKNKGYVQTIEAAAAGESDASVTGGILPMLAHTFDKQGHKITYPAYVQPKLDGHRCIAIRQDGVWTLWSRTRKPITGVPHIIAALAETTLPDGTILDGELYNHDYREKFEELTSFIKRPEPKAGHEVVQYHVYDVVNDKAYIDRLDDVMDMWCRLTSEGHDVIIAVRTEEVADEDEAMEWFDIFLGQGYEGLMLRNAKSKYVNKRSYDLIKVKLQQDSEFTITGVESGRGRMADKAIFVCALPDGRTFKAKMKGSLDSLRQYVDDPSLAIGKQLTVQYQNLTADGIPRFPVGLRLRDDV